MSRKFVALFLIRSQALLIFAAVLLLYYPIFGVYFSQDDFFHFKASQTDGSLGSFIKLFGFPTFEERGYAFYRPLLREGFYNIYYQLFGLSAFPFRVLSFGVHLFNIFLVYTFLQKLFGKRELSLFTAFFFGISAANVGVLYYLAGGIETSGATLFTLLALIFFWAYLEGRQKRFKLLSLVAWLLGLASHELAAVTLFLLIGLIIVRQKSLWGGITQTGRELWSFFIILLAYLYLDIVHIGFLQDEEQYRIIVSAKTAVNSLAWYSGWALGLPEMLIDFVRPGLTLNPSLMRYWGEYFRVIFLAFFGAVALLTFMFIFLLVRARSLFKDRRFWFLALWFPLSLSPVILLPLHKSTYYLALGLPAFWGAIGFLILNEFWIFERRHRGIGRVLLGSLVTLLFLLSATSAKLGDSTYWAASRGRIAERLLNEVRSTYPQLPKGAAVYFKNDPNYPFVAQEWGSTSKQASFVLNGEDALQLFYRDPTLAVFYEDLGGTPNEFPKDNVYPVIARL